MVGRAIQAKKGLESFRVILELVKKKDGLQKDKWILIEGIYNMRE